MGYEPATLAQLGKETWAFLRTRAAGRAENPFRHLAGIEPDSRVRPISVIEIVTDDMPFLVDSVMAELTERGLEVRLVVHPVFTVQRDAGRPSRRFCGSSVCTRRRAA